jgi:hypothetical protein
MRRPVLPILMASASLVAFSPKAHAEPPAGETDVDVEAPDYPPPSTRWKVAGVGLLAGAAFYGMGVGVSYLYPDVPGTKDLRTPVVGPWIALSHNGCGSDLDCTNVLVAARAVLMVLGGAAQAGSIGVVLEGLFMPTQEPPAAPALPRAPAPAPRKPAPGGEKNLFFIPTPMTIGAGGVGLGVVGTF